MRSLTEHVFYIGQINSVIGDMEGNSQKIIKALSDAKSQGATIAIFPELALSGYLPKDLLFNPAFMQEIHYYEEKIRETTQGIIVILGAPWKDRQDRIRNAALVMKDQELVEVVYKVLLPDYDVFNESRYFKPASSPQVVTIEGTKFGIQICEDAWDHIYLHDIPVTHIQGKLGAEIIINISASPFYTDKGKERLQLVQRHVLENQVPFIYVNCVGGQDDLVFDGRSFIVNEDQELIFTLAAFKEDSGIFNGNNLLNSIKADENAFFGNKWSNIIEAVKLNLRDYMKKLELQPKLLVALSGGVDSALTAWLATEAVGSENVVCCYLPSKFSSDRSRQDAQKLTDAISVTLLEFSIEEIRQQLTNLLIADDSLDSTWTTADENIQARLRSTIMMYLSNKIGGMVISTGNKSEIATGYCTIYGDTVGGKNLIGDLYKTDVYELCNFINSETEIIPKSILDREPTAELKFDQRDSDSLPAYDLLDEILMLYLEKEQSRDQIVNIISKKEGIDTLEAEKLVQKVVNLVNNAEFKRRQMPLPVKLSSKSFGYGRTVPIAHRFKF